MSTPRRIAIVLLSTLAVILFLFVAATLVMTNTNWGRSQVRSIAISQLEAAIEGQVTLSQVEGNLLREVRLVDVAIVDTAGRPFVRADTLSTGYSLLGLLAKRIILHRTHLVNAEVVLDSPPDEDWNFIRIFVPDPDEEAEPTAWGNWIELRDVTLVNSRVTVRTQWHPPDDLSGPEREEAVRQALAGETRQNVIEVPGGFQNVMDYRELNAELARVLVAHPDTAAIPIDVESFSGIVQPFSPPAAVVHDLSGHFRLVGDSLFFYNVDAVLPDSRLSGGGVYAMEHGELLLQLDGSPVALADLRWLYPPLPEEGGGTLTLGLQMRALSTVIDARDVDLRIGESELAGKLGLIIADTLRMRDTDLQFRRLDTRLIQDLAPMLDVPRHGLLTGHVMLDGSDLDMQVDSDITFEDFAGGTSRVLARGEVSAAEDVRVENLDLRLSPLQVDLVRAFAPDIPLRGEIEGRALLTGTAGGLMNVDGDLLLRDPRAGASRILADGGIDMREELRLRNLLLRFDPVRLDILRDDVPEIPAGGALVGHIRLDGYFVRALRLDGDLTLNDPASGVSRVVASGGVAFGESMRFSDMRLRAEPLQLDLLRPYAPDLPSGATAAGPVRLHGRMDGLLDVEANLVVDDPQSGISRLRADGGIDLGDELHFRSFGLWFDPLRMELVRGAVPDSPLGGTLEGTAILSGAPSTHLDVRADIIHVVDGERSHITGGGEIAMGGSGQVNLDLRLQPLSLRTAGRFAPEAGLRGTASGRLRVHGNMADLRLDSDLSFQDGGRMQVSGWLDLEAEEPAYDVDLQLADFDLDAVTRRAPAATSLSGSAIAEGRGTDPATMRARVDADFMGSEVDAVAADEVRLRLQIDEGLVSLDRSTVRLGSAEVELDGSFGLIAGRDGRLAYRVEIDSLHALAPWIPAADTAVVAPRPAARDRALAEIREETQRRREHAEVEYLATGVYPDDLEDVDTIVVAEIPQDSLAGSLAASGFLEGNIEWFDARGSAEVEDLVYLGNFVGQGQVDYALMDLGAEELDVELDASFERLFVGGFTFDRATVDGTYRGGRFGTGEVELAIEQTDDTDLRLDAGFGLSAEGNEIQLHDMEVRLDTLTWFTTGPSVVNWGGAGVEVRALEFESTAGGRIFVDGDLPIDGPADFQVSVTDLDINHIYILLQEDADARGLLALDAHVQGPRDRPEMEGEATLVDASFDEEPVPDVRLTFAYDAEELSAEGDLTMNGERVAQIDARIPIDLSLANDGPGLLERPMRIDFRAQRLPLDALPAFTDQVEAVEGTIAANLSVRGTPSEPSLEGDLSFVLPSLRIVPLGVRFERIVGRARSQNGVLRIDTLVAWSGGPLYVTGDVDLASITTPAFDLQVNARETWVMDTRDARILVDADLEVSGPIDGLAITGEVRTRRGVIYVPELSEFGSSEVINLDDPAVFERVDTLLLAQREIVAERSPLMENLEIDVEVQIDRDLWLRSREANVEIYTPPEIGPLHVRMTGLQETPTIEGTINTDRGEYEYMSRRFTLTRGAVNFMAGEEINPILQVAAEHEVNLPGREALIIRIVLSGTLQDPEITLESNAQPPIAQTDLLSFLAFGREASSLLQGQGTGISGQGTAGGGLVGNVAGLATQQYAALALNAMVSRIEVDVAREFGLDVFRITPSDVPAEVFTGGYDDILRGTEVEVGSYIAPRLFVAGQVWGDLVYPGARVEFRTRRGLEWTASFRPRYLPEQPTLRERSVDRVGVFGSFVFREWRF